MKQYLLILMLCLPAFSYGSESSSKQRCTEWAEMYSVEEEDKEIYIEECLINLSYEDMTEQELDDTDDSQDDSEVMEEQADYN